MEYNYDLKIFSRLNEGGNVFKGPDKQPITQRINKENIAPSLKWVEKILGMDLSGYLGTTGKKASSGDIDVSVDDSKYDRKEVANRLKAWAKANGQKPGDWVKLSGDNVHFKVPIRNDAGEHIGGYAQLDLMFGNPQFQKWSMRGEPGKYKGMHRHILMSSIAKANGMKWSYKHGLVNRATNEIISQDPNEIAAKLLPGATAKDFNSVESILNFIYKKYKNDPATIEKLIGEAHDTLAQHYGVELPMPNSDQVHESNDTDEYFLARLRDRIVVQDMSVLLHEHINLNESSRIEHPEDLVFSQGSQGIKNAIHALENMSKNTKDITIKWDGKPAIIFGRDDNGDFILTDKSGFKAKGYNGLAKSPEDIKKIMAQRKGDRGDLVAMYTKLFPLLEKVTPPGFKGFVFADLLYYNTPPVKNGKVIFTPNTVTYAVDVKSDIGKRIAQSEVGVAAHTYIDGVGGSAHPVKHIADKMAQTKEVVVLDPYFTEHPSVKLDPKYIKALTPIMKKAGAIDQLFKPATLKLLKISDFPGLVKRYINSKVSEGNFDNLPQGFIKWLPSFTTEAKLGRMMEHIANNKEGLAAVFKSFLIISKAKESLVNQLDQQSGPVHASINGEPGHEGYVAAGDAGNVKLVDRMRFSRANFAKNA